MVSNVLNILVSSKCWSVVKCSCRKRHWHDDPCNGLRRRPVRHLEVVSRLQIQPALGIGTKVTLQTQGRIRRNPPTLVSNVIHPRGRDIQRLREGAHTEEQRFQVVLPKNFPWVNGSHSIFEHLNAFQNLAPSMSVFNTLIVRAAQKAKLAYSGVHGISEQDVLFQFALKTITALLRLAVLQHCLRLRALFSFLMQIGITAAKHGPDPGPHA